MHPAFQDLFCTPDDHRPLHYEGAWLDQRWAGGALVTSEGNVRVPVEGGIPTFVAPQDDPWGDDDAVEALMREHGVQREGLIRSNWESSMARWRQYKDRTWVERVVDGLGRALIIACGAGGSHVPQILDLAPEATLLLNDIGRWVMVEWARFVAGRGTWPGVSGAQFDARRMPIRSNSLDTVDSSSGIGEIGDPERLLPELYRVLKPGGRLTLNEGGGIDPDCLRQFPTEGLQELRTGGFVRDGPGLREQLIAVGFEIGEYRYLKPHEVNLGRSTLADIASKHGVTLRIAGQLTEAVKPLCI